MTICPGLDEVAQVLPFSVVSWFEQQIAFNQFYLWFLCQIDESLQIFLGMVNPTFTTANSVPLDTFGIPKSLVEMMKPGHPIITKH